MKRIISCAILFSSVLSFTSAASGILTEKNLSSNWLISWRKVLSRPVAPITTMLPLPL
ncbi:Uncharacterised protein [Serratia fonticola]|uniref:Uncharacterized protein n=1 Tax=Serratia fonticola TaxID=47917 RepID=A0A3S4Z6X4_SERFO|nr:Uncharacterised protein [Serratia fonticola]